MYKSNNVTIVCCISTVVVGNPLTCCIISEVTLWYYSTIITKCDVCLTVRSWWLASVLICLFSSSIAMVGTFFAIFVMALLYEGLKVFREVLHRNKSKIFGKIGPNTVQYMKVPSSAELVPQPNSYK